jgi:hypothetical protein
MPSAPPTLDSKRRPTQPSAVPVVAKIKQVGWCRVPLVAPVPTGNDEVRRERTPTIKVVHPGPEHRVDRRRRRWSSPSCCFRRRRRVAPCSRPRPGQDKIRCSRYRRGSSRRRCRVDELREIVVLERPARGKGGEHERRRRGEGRRRRIDDTVVPTAFLLT